VPVAVRARVAQPQHVDLRVAGVRMQIRSQLASTPSMSRRSCAHFVRRPGADAATERADLPGRRHG
jgi:hypothetical protein